MEHDLTMIRLTGRLHRRKGFHEKILYSDKVPIRIMLQDRIIVDRIFENLQKILSCIKL